MKKRGVLFLMILVLTCIFAGCNGRDTMKNSSVLVGTYDENELIEKVMDIYIPHSEMKALSRVVYASDVRKCVEFSGVENITEGNYVFETQIRRLVLSFNEYGELIDLLNIGNDILSKSEFEKIKPGCSFNEVLEQDPSAILYRKAPALLTDKEEIWETPISEHILEDGSVYVLEYRAEGEKYIVQEISRMDTCSIDKDYLESL